MAIIYNEAKKLFHLTGGNVSYVIGILNEDVFKMVAPLPEAMTGAANAEAAFLANPCPVHLYWGPKLADDDVWYLIRDVRPAASFDMAATRMPMEYATGAFGDMRTPACRVIAAGGDPTTVLTYVGHDIFPGKPGLPGLPATYVECDCEADTLVLHLVDSFTGLEVDLMYTIYAESGAIARSVRFKNPTEQPMQLLEAASMTCDLFGTDYEMIHLWGGWAIERSVQRVPVIHGQQRIASRRGASGHEHNPFMAVVQPETTEFSGDAYGFNFVYSGSHALTCEANSYETTRVTVGLNPDDFTWKLEGGESFQTPEAVMVYSDQGLNGMSQIFHKLYRTRLARGMHRDEPRPILVNNWEATYFQFNEEKIMAIAEKAAQMGIEMFVLDDGWFGKRDLDNSSLGDWVVYQDKLPNGLKSLADKIHGLGLKFGLWFEPEMVSPDSDLYRAHPEWCLHVEGRARSLARNQLILDLSREDVCDYIVNAVCAVLESAPIDYVKWDMNRNMIEIGNALLPADRQREVAHRYMLGLYRVLETITGRFPNVLFESCSGGGGRFDAGMLYYMPQTWTSDDTDAVERLKIQYATSMAYPTSAMGAHVSAVPNHQTNRTTGMQMRGDVALSGNYGYELDLSKLSEEDVAIAMENIRMVKRVRTIVQQGEFTRLVSPFGNDAAAWQFVSPDEREVVACYFGILCSPNPGMRRLRLRGLKADATYVEQKTGVKYSGSVLMGAGLAVPAMHDFESFVAHLIIED